MSWRPGAKAAAFVALAFLSLAAIAPFAAADHAYSHRYLVFGRVVDAEGNPVPGLTVDLGYEPPFEAEGPCADQPGTATEAWGPSRTSPVTNQYGEFIFCFHTHSMSRSTPGVGIIRIPAEEVDQRFEFDGSMRYSYVTVELDRAHPNANKTIADESYTVFGRAWQPASRPIHVESVRVYGDTVQREPVTITFTYNGREPLTVNTTTNNYGDFAVRIPVEERPTTGTVEVRIQNQTFTSAVNPQLGVTALRAEIEEPSDPFVQKLLIGLVVVAAVVGGGGALWFTTHRVKSAREQRALRQTSSRKRAKK